MNWVADILLIIVLALTIFIFAKKGFFKSVMSFAKLGITLILTYLIGKPVAASFNEKVFGPSIYESVHKKLSELAASAADDIDGFFESIPESFKSIAEKFGTDIDAMKSEFGSGSEVTSDMVNNLSEKISTPISSVISAIVGYLLVFVAIFVILTIVVFILDKFVFNLPVLKTFNALLGALLGIVCGFLFMCIATYVLTAIFNMTSTGALAVADKSIIFKLFYNIDIFGILKG